MNIKLVLGLLMALMLLPQASAAIINGAIYDLDLNKVDNAVIEIDTIPKQQLISKDGTYRFEVSKGNYTIKASLWKSQLLQSASEENILVKDNGTYVIDLILFPVIDNNLAAENISVDEIVTQAHGNYWLIIITALALIAILFISRYKLKTKNHNKFNKQQESSLDNDLYQVLEIIKQQGGRTTQKEIRKKIPYSEAKISLLIADLEHRDLVKKLKKGRGNIIILK